jgi:gamma-glutamylputrescine oxidase
VNYSFWEKKIISNPTDITIIGAGIVGLSAAISIKEKSPHMTVKIIERGSMPYGASTKNAGFCCFGSISELLEDIDSMGESACMEVVKMRWKGLNKLRARVGDQPMQYKNQHGTEIFRKSDKILQETCFSKINYCNDLMVNYLGIENTYSIKDNDVLQAYDPKMIINQHEGSINPMYMMQRLFQLAISLGVEIFYGINISTIDTENHFLLAEHMNIDFKKLIVCTNGFAQQLCPELDVVPARNQVLITHPIQGFDLPSCYHLDKGYVYFRVYENRILLGGGRNIGGIEENTDQFGSTDIVRDYLHTILEEICPGTEQKIDMYWSGILGIGPSKLPICKFVNKDMLVGVRMGGMGVAIGSHLGETLATKIVESD